MSKLEQEILNCRIRDTAELKRALGTAWRICTAAHDPSADAMEQAKLACQQRDAADIRETVAALSHGHAPRGLGGAARA